VSTPNGAGSNPQVGGSGADPSGANPQVGGRPNPNPAPGAPAADPKANPQVGGPTDPQAPAPDETGPVARDVYNERVRAEAALRKSNAEFRERLKALEDKELTDQERVTRRVAELEAEKASNLDRLQKALLMRAVDARVREHNLADPDIVIAILKAEFSDLIEYDEQGNPLNAEYCIDRAVEKHPSLVQAPTSPQPPSSGRSVSPPRTPAGQYAPRQPTAEPKAPKDWTPLGALSKEDWDKLGGNQG
jgi:hypothetical protein